MGAVVKKQQEKSKKSRKNVWCEYKKALPLHPLSKRKHVQNERVH